MNSFIASLLVGTLAIQPVPSLDNGIDLALGRAGLSRSDAQFDQSLMGFYREGSFASPFYHAAISDVWRTPQFLGVFRNEVAMGSSDVYSLVSIVSRLTGSGSRRNLLGNPAGSNISAMNQPGYLNVVLGRMQDKGLISGAIPALTNVPDDVQAAAALVLD